MRAMVCLVSRQTMQNVLPILMYVPSNVYLLTTTEEKESGERIQRLCKQKKIAAELVEGIDAYDAETVRSAIERIKSSTTQAELAINITGGTKLMSIAAYEVAKQYGIRAFYCNTERKEIIHLIPNHRKEQLSTVLTIEDYLQAHGFTIVEEKTQKELSQFFEFLQCVQEQNHFQSLNALFKRIHERGLDAPKFSIQSPDKIFTFQKNFDVYQFCYNGSETKVLNVHASHFNLGNWLEYWVYMKLQRDADSIKTGVKVVSEHGVENEIDIMMLKEYVLYLLSCKSGRLNSQEALQQLETLRLLMAGTFGKGYLVLTNTSKGILNKCKARARELRITVCTLHTTNGEIQL